MSGLALPVPEDVPLLLAGWELGLDGRDAVPVALGASAGVLTRDTLAFLLGRWLGPRIEERPRVHRFLGPRRLAWAHAAFARHGERVVLLTRLALGVRAPLYFVAGSLGVPFRRFFLADLAGIVVTVPLTLWLGARLGPGAADALVVLLARQRLVLAGLLLLGVIALLRRRGSAP